MPAPNEFLNQSDAELEEFLVRLARNELVPEAARQRALLGVASATAGTGLLAKLALAHGSPSSVAKSTAWLVAKWLTLGAGAGALTISVAQSVEHLATPSAPTASARVQSATTARPARRKTAQKAGPEPEHEPALSAPEAPAVLVPTASVEDATLPPTGNSAPAGNAAPNAVSAGAPSAASVPSAPAVHSLSDELSLLELVRTELAHHHEAQALRGLSEYGARFPHGALQVEAAALRIEAIGQSGDRKLARKLAESFLASHPTSPLATRVRAFIPANAGLESE